MSVLHKNRPTHTGMKSRHKNNYGDDEDLTVS